MPIYNIQSDTVVRCSLMSGPMPRMADEWACVASVMLAIVLAHAIGADMVSWAAFTAFVLLKSDVSETLLRGVLRIVGPIQGEFNQRVSCERNCGGERLIALLRCRLASQRGGTPFL